MFNQNCPKTFFSLRPVYFRRSLPNPAASGGRCSIGNQQCRSILHFGNNYRAVGKHVYNLRKVAAALKSDFIGLPVGQQCMGHGLNRITGIFFFDCGTNFRNVLGFDNFAFPKIGNLPAAVLGGLFTVGCIGSCG